MKREKKRGLGDMGTFSGRQAELKDLEAVQEIVTACDIDEFGTAEYVLEIKEIWESVPLSNTWVIIDEEAQTIIGYGFIEEMGKGRLDTYGFVHPDHKGKGIGSLLLDSLEEVAGEYIKKYQDEGIKYEFNNVIPHNSPTAKALVESRGYAFKRIYSLMKSEFEKEPELLSLPQGITIRTCETEEQEKAIYEVYVEAFKDSNSFYPKPYEEWIQDRKKQGVDQSLWFCAYMDGELAGFLLAQVEDKKMWVGLLGTKPSARKKGIGALLLNRIFAEAYRRGYLSVALTVDEYSKTNASRVYVNAGMKPVFQMAMYEKK
jgi:mycothiol synthase